MSEDAECERIAHRAGFVVSVGNWISPSGQFIMGENPDTHHWQTLKAHLNIESDPENYLEYMSQKVSEGYIRLVFRAEVMFQVNCLEVEMLWKEQPNCQKMMDLLGMIPDIFVHIFSQSFYLIGIARDIVEHKLDKLQIRKNK